MKNIIINTIKRWKSLDLSEKIKVEAYGTTPMATHLIGPRTIFFKAGSTIINMDGTYSGDEEFIQYVLARTSAAIDSLD